MVLLKCVCLGLINWIAATSQGGWRDLRKGKKEKGNVKKEAKGRSQNSRKEEYEKRRKKLKGKKKDSGGCWGRGVGRKEG